MAANKRRRDPIPKEFRSIDEFWKFWDSHSTADYQDQMEDVEVSVNIRSQKVYCPIAHDIVQDIRKEAERQGVSTETLVNVWLKEKLDVVHS